MKPDRDRPEFDIGALSRMTGINASTIRTWENRYGVFTPDKTETGRRIYGQEDVNRLVLIRNLMERGHKISKLGNFSTDQLSALLQAAPTMVTETPEKNLFNGLVAAIDNDDIERFRRWLAFSVSEVTPQAAVSELFLPILRLIGDRWHKGQLDIAQEHMLSEVIRNQLLTSISGLKATEEGPLVAFTTLAGETHEFGALMACYLASSKQLRTVYFGANLPVADLVSAAIRMKVDLIVVSSILVTEALESELNTLSQMIDGRIPVWLGSRSDQNFSQRRLGTSVRFLPDLSLFESSLNGFILASKQAR